MMKSKFYTCIALMEMFSMNAQACKMSEAGASAVRITAAVNKYANQLANSSIRSATAIGWNKIEVRAQNGQVFNFKVTINADCSTTVE